MTPLEVEKLAREAGGDFRAEPEWAQNWMFPPEGVARFAELIERAAMEKAAKMVLDDEWTRALLTPSFHTFSQYRTALAAAIRAAAKKEA